MLDAGRHVDHGSSIGSSRRELSFHRKGLPSDGPARRTEQPSVLKTRIALKGGSALNLFYFDVPRLSVDIDLNSIGAADRETMLAERPKLEQAVQAVCSREGLTVRRMPSEHAGGKWRLT